MSIAWVEAGQTWEHGTRTLLVIDVGVVRPDVGEPMFVAQLRDAETRGLSFIETKYLVDGPGNGYRLVSEAPASTPT